jgi:DNA polymerase-3 subunit delta'
MFTPERGGILITGEIAERASQITETLRPLRCVSYVCDDFKIEDAKEVIAEAYKAEENTKTLILGAKTFNVPAQNALLKILEEPPRNIVFILMAPNKSTFLPTIRSRLTLHIETKNTTHAPLDISLGTLDLARLFAWVKEHEKLKKHEAKELITQLWHHAVYVEKLSLSSVQMDSFDKAIRLIELNGRFQTILVMLLMGFLKESSRGR